MVDMFVYPWEKCKLTFLNSKQNNHGGYDDLLDRQLTSRHNESMAEWTERNIDPVNDFS